MKKRLDIYLTDLGFYSSRSKAKDAIKRRKVKLNGQICTRSSELVDELSKIELIESERYVGRGALKLKDALESFALDAKNKVAADFGASTGGFTEVLLNQGAKHVYAIDVGRNQLDEKLKQDVRVTNLEQTNIRDLDGLPQKIQIGAVDLSFISLKQVLPQILNCCDVNCDIVVLFKPQFEVGRENVPKDGIVKDLKIIDKTLLSFESFAFEQGFEIRNKKKCAITGKKGNQEYLIHLRVRDKEKE